jgi:hypothetical protein
MWLNTLENTKGRSPPVEHHLAAGARRRFLGFWI